MALRFSLLRNIRHFKNTLDANRASLVAQLVKNPPAMQETWVHCLGWEDPLEKGMATTPVFWPGEFHGQRSLAGYPRGCKESDTTEQLSLDGRKKRGFMAVKDLGQNSIAFFYLLGNYGDLTSDSKLSSPLFVE